MRLSLVNLLHILRLPAFEFPGLLFKIIVIIFFFQVNSSSDVNVFRQTGNIAEFVRFSERAVYFELSRKLNCRHSAFTVTKWVS